VVGRTGAGKTTLTRLVPRLYDPSSGCVRLGGVDPREIQLRGVRARVGVVTQDVQLFAASLRDNLTLFDDAIPDARVVSVLAELGLDEWLRALPHGLATEVSAAGLSAGQAQLIACARIFLRDPDVVILDEASSRLDPVSERLIHEALRRLLAGRTGIVVAHRLATLAFADDILVLENGRAREHGPRLALAADPTSRFAELLRLAGEEAIV
jgi:ABC-type multidrug transport system fused ATPase/permease subunit